MKILENGLIPIYEGENGKNLVDGRELHSFLEVGKDFTTWIKDKISKYGFIENEDYSVTLTKTGERSNVIKHEYTLTIDTAKEISMVENNEKGSQARKYFIAVEKKFKELSKPSCIEDVLIQSLQEMKDIRLRLETVKKAGAEVKQEIQNMRDVYTLSPNSWRTDTTRLINSIAKVLGGFEHIRLVREESYKLLDERAGARLGIRLANMKKNVQVETGSKAKADKVSKLDVIAADKRLIEVYCLIVKEMAIKYKAA